MQEDWSKGLQSVSSAEELRSLLGPVMKRALTRVRSELHPVDIQWLNASPFCFVGTASADGDCDVSPKGDPAGFLKVLDKRTLAIPERPGNRRGDGFFNVLSNPHAGIISLIPGRDDTLRVNGKARIIKDAPFFDSMRVGGHRPKLALLLEVEQVFYHCSKAFLRAELWSPTTWAPHELPSRAALVKAAEDTETPLSELEAFYGPGYERRLYNDDPGN